VEGLLDRRFNEAMIAAGVMVDGAGLQPSSKGARVAFPGGQVQVTDGRVPEIEVRQFFEPDDFKDIA
jgi:hypothetical protein